MSHPFHSGLANPDVRLDITDLYLFRGEMGTVFIMNVNRSAARAGGGNDASHPPGFHPAAHYQFHIDVDGDAVEELLFRVTFGPRCGTSSQPLELHLLVGSEARQHAASGTLLAWGSSERSLPGRDGIRLWAGCAAEFCYVDPNVLGAIRHAVRLGHTVDRVHPVSALARSTVHPIVLEVPDRAFAGLIRAQQEIGLWATTTLATDAGGWRPVNRMGKPMIQSMFSTPGDDWVSDYNTTHPSDDWANFGELFTSLVARIAAAYGSSDDPVVYGASVARMLLPDLLRYRIGTPASFTVAFRNGRGLIDNAPRVMFSVVTKDVVSDGLSWDDAAVRPVPHFPYVAALHRKGT